jgi:hypothetical protein
MPRYDFTSPGALAGNAIQEFLIRRALEERQARMDKLVAEKQSADIGLRAGDLGLRREQEARIAQAQQQAQQDLEHQREFGRATTIAENAIPGDPTDEATYQLLQRQGYVGQARKVPGVMMRGPLPETQTEADRPTGPDTYEMRGGSKYLSARAAEEARAAQAEAAQGAAAERAQADRDLKEMIARLAASGHAESRTLSDELKRMQIGMLGEKIDTAQKEKVDKATAVAAGRAKVRELAQGLIDDPALNAISGPMAARTPDLLPASVDAARRLSQLVNSLSVEERSKLKGQGAVSDFEGRMLASSVSAIDRAAGPENVKKHLREILEAFQGDAPRHGPTSGGTPSGGGTVRMRAPDGRSLNVPADQVEAAKARGATLAR